MRICSLLPGATEVVAALGLAERLVGVSHECDDPPSVRHLPVLVRPLVAPDGSSSGDIDRRIKIAVAAGQPLYELDEDAFRRARPDVVLTQDLCHVCAVTPDQLARAVRTLAPPPAIVALHAATLHEVLTDVERIAEALGRRDEGRALVQALRARLCAVAAGAAGARRPRVACLEWLDPPYVAGHWVPDMVQTAGGDDVLGVGGAPSRETTWQEVAAADPDVVILMPCGYRVENILQEWAARGRTGGGHPLPGRGRAWFAVDAASYFSRPGPRLVDGVELLADILHPQAGRPLHPARAVPVDPVVPMGTPS